MKKNNRRYSITCRTLEQHAAVLEMNKQQVEEIRLQINSKGVLIIEIESTNKPPETLNIHFPTSPFKTTLYQSGEE